MWKDFIEKARQNAGFRAFQISEKIWKGCGRITISIHALHVERRPSYPTQCVQPTTRPSMCTSSSWGPA